VSQPFTKAGLVVVANARLPSHRAQSLQVLQASAALARSGVATTVVHARRRVTPTLPPGVELQDYYGVPRGQRAEVVAVSCVDWVDRVPRGLQYLPARLQELSFSRNAARWVRANRPQATVLSREVEAARQLLASGHERVFLEIHRVPGGRTRRRWLVEAAHRARGVIAISGGVCEDLLALGLDPSRVHVEHDAFDPDLFAGIASRAQARQRLDLPADAPLVVYTGGLLDWKGVDVLLEAAQRLPHARFLVAGGMEDDLERLAPLAAALSNVRLDGFQPPRRVPDYLAAADVLVVPNRSRPAISARYTSPLKLFEAMAVGRAVVASDLPSLRELLTHDHDAWLVAPDDAEALAQGLRRVLEDSALRHRLGSTLAERADRHTWDARAGRLIEWMEATG